MKLEEYILKNEIKNVNIISSYHNHNYLCLHAGGKVIDYVKEAKKKGLKTIGISDHGPSKINKERMNYETFYTEYLPQFDDVSDNSLNVRCALEVEYNRNEIEELTFLRGKVDYFILGQHYIYSDNNYKMVHSETLSDADYKIYRDLVIEGLNTGLFSILAHPDIVFFNNEKISEFGLKCLEEIILECIRLNVYLEVNANGLRRKGIGDLLYRYPRQEYLDLLKKHNAKCIISDDAHDPKYLVDDKTRILYSYLVDEGFNLIFDPNL